MKKASKINVNPLISIIVPVYNVERYLSRCIESILRQTYSNFECVIVDDGSKDKSGRIADEWESRDSRIKVFHKPNGGLSDARNYGIRVCKGEFITYVDSDDWILDYYLESLLNALLISDADIAVSKCFRTSGSPEIESSETKVRYRTYTQEEYLDKFFRFKGNEAVHYAWGKLYRREVVSDEQFPIGMLNEDVEGFFKSLLKAEKVVEINNKIYCYYINPDSITQKNFGENYLNLRQVWKRVVEIAKTERPDLVSSAVYNLQRADFTILVDMIVHGNKDSDTSFQYEQSCCLKRLRSNLPHLLMGRMRLDRKICAIAVAYFYSPFKNLYRFARR